MDSQVDEAMLFAGRTVFLAQMLIDVADFVPERYIAKNDPNMHLNPCEIQGRLRGMFKITVGITDFDNTAGSRFVGGPVHAYVKASPKHLRLAGRALRAAVAHYAFHTDPLIDTNGLLARVLSEQLPAPTATAISNAVPGPPPLPRWAKYADPDTGRPWWSNDDDFFWEDSPGAWQRYTDPDTGRFWWWNGVTQSSFITDEK